MTDLDPGEYEVCSYCNKSLYPGVMQCPYCGEYTDNQGKFGAGQKQRLSKTYVIVGWILVVCFLLALVVGLFRALG